MPLTHGMGGSASILPPDQEVDYDKINRILTAIQETSSIGWQCPLCKVVWRPDILSCGCATENKRGEGGK